MPEPLCSTEPAYVKDYFTEDQTEAVSVLRRGMAIAICGNCPLQSECLREGMEAGATGIYGGRRLDRGIPVMEKGVSKDAARKARKKIAA
jgi:Transcription factor WhiB